MKILSRHSKLDHVTRLGIVRDLALHYVTFQSLTNSVKLSSDVNSSSSRL
jgi:hypothetical protein